MDVFKISVLYWWYYMLKDQFPNLFFVLHFRASLKKCHLRQRWEWRILAGWIYIFWTLLILDFIISIQHGLLPLQVLLWFSEKHPHLLDPIPLTKGSRDSQTIRNFGRGSLNPRTISSVWLLTSLLFGTEIFALFVSSFDEYCTNVNM